MQLKSKENFQFFCAYVAADQKYYDALQKHLKPLLGKDKCTLVGPNSVKPGDDKESALRSLMDEAHVLILLLSSDLIGTDEGARYIEWARKVTQQRAEWKSAHPQQKHVSKGIPRIFPIKVRSVDLLDTGLEELVILPRDLSSIASASDQDQAWAEVTSEIRTTLKDMGETEDLESSSNTKSENDQPISQQNKAFYDYARAKEYYALGQYSDAQLHFEKAIEIRKQLLFDEPANMENRKDVSASRYWLGHLKFLNGDYSGAKNEFALGLELYNESSIVVPANDAIHRTRLVLMYELGTAHMELGELDTAETLLIQSLKLAEELNRKNSKTLQSQRDLSVALLRLGEALLRRRQARQALNHFTRAAEICEAMSSADMELLRADQLRGLALIGCGDAHFQEGDIDKGIEYYSQAESILNTLVSRDKGNVQWLYFSAVAYYKKGLGLSERQNVNAALQAYAKSAAALASATSLSDCVIWRIELMERYANAWDICRREGTASPFALTYTADRVQYLRDELNSSGKLAAEMKDRIRALENHHPLMFLSEAASVPKAMA